MLIIRYGSSKHRYAPLPLLESRSQLEWFIRRVQDRIVVSTLRHFAVKSENTSRSIITFLFFIFHFSSPGSTNYQMILTFKYLMQNNLFIITGTPLNT